MKKIKLFKSVLVLLSIFLLASCSRDDDALGEKSNHIKVKSKSFSISSATVIDKDTSNGITEFEIIFASAGIIVNGENVTGKGDLLTATLTASKQTELAAGEYVFNKNDNTSFLVNGGVHYFNYDASLGDNQSGDVDLESGSISVAVENNQYTFTFNLVDETDVAVTGYYKGIIAGF